MSNEIWSNSAASRLTAVRKISTNDLIKIQESFCRGCPVEPWPYGNATSINPLLVTLGASPGNSPSSVDANLVVAGSQQLPTAGSPHPGTQYQDTAGYWSKLRNLAVDLLMPDGGTEADALALFGNVNLDTGRSGEANKVAIDVVFAAWVLRNVCDGLKPRFLILLGLAGILKDNLEIGSLFERTFSGFRVGKPKREYQFKAYTEKKLVFREWDVLGSAGNQITIVLWPQHPSRAPFTNVDIWRASSKQFSQRYRHVMI